MTGTETLRPISPTLTVTLRSNIEEPMGYPTSFRLPRLWFGPSSLRIHRSRSLHFGSPVLLRGRPSVSSPSRRVSTS